MGNPEDTSKTIQDADEAFEELDDFDEEGENETGERFGEVSATAGMPSVQVTDDGKTPVERVKKDGNRIRVSAEEQKDINGMKASEYFNPENIPQGIKDAVRADRESRGYEGPKKPSEKTLLTPLGQPFALFKHTEFTEEEDSAICSAILAGIPLYLIADKLHTSRGNLSRHIKESKLLSQAWEDRDESILDHVEFQAKRLVDSGNPAMIMFWLERKGKSRGWGQQEIAEVPVDDGRIVFGEISDSDISAADSVVSRAREDTAKDVEVGLRLSDDGHTAELGTVDGGTMRLPTPMEVAQTMQAVAEMDAERDAAERAREARTAEYRKSSVDVETVKVSPSDPASDVDRVEPTPISGGGMPAGQAPYGGGGGGWEDQQPYAGEYPDGGGEAAPWDGAEWLGGF